MRWQDFRAQAVSPDVFCSAPPRRKCQSCHVSLRLGEVWEEGAEEEVWEVGEVEEEEGGKGQTAFGR